MLKIENAHAVGEAMTLRLEGRVIGPWVGELRRLCEGALAAGGGLTLDMSEVSFIDREGVGLFRRLKDRQVALRNCSPFVTEQLKAELQ